MPCFFLLFGIQPDAIVQKMQCQTWRDLWDCLPENYFRLKEDDKNRLNGLNSDLSNVVDVAVTRGFPHKFVPDHHTLEKAERAREKYEAKRKSKGRARAPVSSDEESESADEVTSTPYLKQALSLSMEVLVKDVFFEGVQYPGT